MKLFAYLLVITVLATACGAQDAASLLGFTVAGSGWTPLELEPVAWYKADDNALDASGNANDAQWLVDTNYTAGVNNKAFRFYAVKEVYVEAPKLLSGDEFSFGAWIKVDASPESASYPYLLSQVNESDYGHCIYVTPSHMYPYAYDGSQTGWGYYSINTNIWYHFVQVCRTNVVEFWVNGEVHASKEQAAITAVDQVFTIGGSFNMWYPTTFDGAIDDVLVVNKALTTNEVQSLYGWRE